MGCHQQCWYVHRGVQFSRKGDFQKFRGLIFADGHSRTAPSTIPPPLTARARGLDPAEIFGCSVDGRRVAYDRVYDLWLSRVQGNLVCCCWRRAILHKRGGELSRSVHCSSGKIGSNRWSRPKKDIGMFHSLFSVDQNSQTLRFWSLALLLH